MDTPVEAVVPAEARHTETSVPVHVGIVLDGNRRWASGRGLAKVDGHREGAKRLFDAVEWSDEAGVRILTLWVLALNNLQRPATELAELLPLIADTIDSLAARQRWRINHIGRAESLPPYLRDSLSKARAATREIDGMTINMAVAYDGRQEIVDAVRRIAIEYAAEPCSTPATRDWEQLITEHLYTHGQRDPELIIRTSGEQRLSGFLLWQSAWSEIYFCDENWPAFTRSHFDAALRSCASRERRFGR